MDLSSDSDTSHYVRQNVHNTEQLTPGVYMPKKKRHVTHCRRCEGARCSRCSSKDTDSKASIRVSIPKKSGALSQNGSLHRAFPLTSQLRPKRAVFKNGEINVEKFKTRGKFGIFSSWFMTIVEARWRWVILTFFMAFTGNWLFFGFLYWLISYNHDDLTAEHLPQNQEATNWTACIENIHGFTSTFLFSVEVHTTVAYGKRAITLECIEAILTMCMQCIVSSIFQSLMIGILFAKLTSPKSRTQTILFSKQAVVNLRNDKLCLIFRVGDMRKSKIINIKSFMFILKLESHSQYLDNFEQIELNNFMDGCESSFFLWPLSIIHEIDENSPLYRISAADMLCSKIEILVVFEGLIESTGQPVQARSSFTECDIFWGHRFVPMVNVSCENSVFKVDFSKLSETENVDTPLCSANEYLAFIKSFSRLCIDVNNESKNI